MKFSLIIALIIAVSGQVLYHVAQKSIPTGANPVVSLLVFYLLAAVLTLPLLFFYPLESGLAAELSKMNIAVAAVALSIVLIEIGFLLAYRAGGALSNTFVMTGGVVAASMLIIGALFFKEAVTVSKLAGIAFCVGGIALIGWKST
jgi:drug/metabolite transporter (DMT)-like permease